MTAKERKQRTENYALNDMNKRRKQANLEVEAGTEHK